MTNSLRKGPRFKGGVVDSIKTVLFDVDNTLVGHESSELPSRHFKKQASRAAGSIRVGLISARPLSKVKHILDFIGHDRGHSIVSNGAQIIRNQDYAVVLEWLLREETCLELLKFASRLGVDFWINDDGVDYYKPGSTGDMEFEVLEDIWDRSSQRKRVVIEKFNKPLVFVIHNVDSRTVAEFHNFVTSCGDDSVEDLVSHEVRQADGSKLYDVLILHKKANKLDALSELAKLEKIHVDNIAVVGDGRNDSVVVGGAGVGIAMGNAVEETLAVATHVTDYQNQDGAAKALAFLCERLTDG